MAVSLKFKTFLEQDFVERFVFTSGYLFTFSSLVLVFVLFNTFKVSDYKKSEANKNFLEKKAFEKLSSSLVIIKDCLSNNETKNLYESCGNVKEVFDSLKVSVSEVELTAYTTEIKPVFSMINKYKLSSIGFHSDVESLKNLSEDDKLIITSKIDVLMRKLEQRRSLDEK